MSLAYRLMLARQKSLASRPPQLGDRVGFVHPEFGTWSGYIIMIITEPDRPTRCEVIVRHGSTGYPTTTGCAPTS